MRWHWGRQAPADDPAQTADPPPTGDLTATATATASPTPTDTPTLAPAPAPGPAPASPPKPHTEAAFIGRTSEQDVFRELLKEVQTGRSALVHLSGTARTGRRALLEQFRAVAKEAGARCGPLIDFEADAGLELDELLERVADGLEPDPEHFKGFVDATKRFRSKEAGQQTRTAQALAAVRAGSSVVSQLAGAFPVKALNTVVQSPLGDVLTEHAETKRTLSTVSDEFVSGLLGLAEAKAPVVLVFGDLDFAPSSAKLLWLRRSLLPRIARARVIVAVSSEPRFELEDVGMLFGRMEQMRLERFSPEEAEEFLVRQIGLDKDSPLGRAVLEDADCFPERLAGYAQYFAEHPDERTTDTLPMQARDLTAGGLASGLLSRIQEPFLRAVLLHAAPLRWFNAELLDGIEDVCRLGKDDDGRSAARLLDLGMRPSWVTNVGGGWGIDVENRRRAILDEFRRLHPRLYRRVHLHAAEYHVTRLRELEAALLQSDDAKPADDARVFDYQPITHPTDRLRWSEYMTSLGEWLYHLVALSPRRGFACLADHVGEAMAWGYPEVATRLLDVGVEVALPASEVLARQRLLEVAGAMRNNRHAEMLQLLDEFAAAGSASAIADASTRYLVGTRLALLGRSPLSVLESHERAERQFAVAGGGVQAWSLRCLNLTRLAGERARREESTPAALELLAQAAELARPLDPRMQAEIERTRGVVLAGAGRIPEALVACDAALDLLGSIGAAAESALVLRLRADVSRRSKDVAEARRNLVSARSIYRQLVDPAAEAGVALGLLELALSEGDKPAASAHEAAIIQLRPDDFLLRNQIGIVYYQAGHHEQAVEHYTAGLAMAREPAIFANRARARARWAAEEEAPADLRQLAREDLATAFELDPDDLDAGIELAELERDLGDGAGAAKTAELVARRVLEVAGDLPPPPVGSPDAPERAGIVRRLRDVLVRGLSLLGPMPAAEILAAWPPAQTEDEELDLIRAIAGHELSGVDGRGLGEAIAAAERAVGDGDPPRGRALVELAALHAQARHWHEARQAAESAMHDETVRVQAEYVLDRLDQMHRRDDEFGGEPETVAEELVVDIAEDLRPWFDPDSPVGKEFFGWMIEAFRRARQERVGLPPPGLWVGVRKELTPGAIHVVVDNAVRMRMTAKGHLLADVTPADAFALAGVEGRPAERPWDGGPATWLDPAAREALEQAGITFWDPRGLVLAGLDQALEAMPRFVSAEEAAALSGEAWVGLSPTEFLRRAAVVQELIAARVPPADLPRVLADYREAAEATRGEVVAAAVRRFAVPVATTQSLAAAFACATFKPPATVGGTGARLATEIVVSVGASGEEAEAAALAAGSGRVIAPFCRALGVPEPELRIEHDPRLGDRGVAVALGGVTRLCASPTSELDWVRCHPVAGPGGRTGKAGTGLGGRVARALEAVLWDDPALLLGDIDAARQAFTPALGGPPSDQVVSALLDALSRRVPLGPASRLKPAVDRLNPRSRTGVNRLPAARTFVSSPRRPVPDNLAFGIRDTLHVDERGRLRQFAVRVLLHHDREADVRVRLTAPTGRTILLHDCGDELDSLRAGVDEEQIPGLAVLLNERAEGDWTLHVQDVSSKDAGLLEEWALELTTVSSHSGAPAPSTAPAIALTDRETRALARSSSLERDLRNRRIEAACGSALWSALEVEVKGGRLQRERVRLGNHLARELGLRFGHSIHFELDEGLAEHGFRIVVNGLVRCTGELSPGRYGQPPDGVQADDDIFVGPLSGLTYARLPDDVPGGFDVPDRLIRYIRAAVREAAPEFADADWSTAFLDRVGHTYKVTVPAVRTAAGNDLLAAVLRELVTQGVTVADPRLLELVPSLVRSPDLAAECLALALAPPRHVGRTAGAMAEWLRERLERVGPDPSVVLLEIGPKIEAAVREAVGSSDARVPVYTLAGAGAILQRLEQARVEQGGGPIGVVTAGPLRRHVHRLIGAQFPTAEVLVRETLDPSHPRVPVDLPA